MAFKDAEYFWNRLRAIPPASIPQSVPRGSEMEQVYKQIFNKVSKVKSISITKQEDLDILLSYYMVWYKKNHTGRAGALEDGSTNYLLSEHLDMIVNDHTKINAETREKIYSIHRDGITQAVEIIATYDTSIKKGVILDGTKRAVAIHYLKRLDCWKLNESDKIEISIFESPCSRVLIPYDFLKLY